MVRIQIVKFELCQYQWRAILSNLMVTHYTVGAKSASCFDLIESQSSMQCSTIGGLATSIEDPMEVNLKLA